MQAIEDRLQAYEIQGKCKRLFLSGFSVLWGRRFLCSTRMFSGTFQMQVGRIRVAKVMRSEETCTYAARQERKAICCRMFQSAGIEF